MNEATNNHGPDKSAIRQEALRFLRSHNTMIVSTVSPDGEPQAATVYFVADEDLNLYFMTSVVSKKCDNLQANGKSAFVIGTGPEVITMQGGGEAQNLDDRETEIFYKLMDGLKDQPLNKWPLVRLPKEKFCTFKIVPKWLVWYNLNGEEYSNIPSNEFLKII